MVFTLAAGFMSAGGAEDQIQNLFLKLLLFVEIPILLISILSFMIGKRYICRRRGWLIGDIIFQLFLGGISGLILLLYNFR